MEDRGLHVDTQTGLPASSSAATRTVHAIKSSCDWVVTAFNQAFLSAHAQTEAADMDKCKVRARGNTVILILWETS